MASPYFLYKRMRRPEGRAFFTHFPRARMRLRKRVWSDHFAELSKTKINDCEGLQHLNDRVQSLYTTSLSNEEYLLGTPFTIEELEHAIRKLKMRKARFSAMEA